jgi:hypothetical protein
LIVIAGGAKQSMTRQKWIASSHSLLAKTILIVIASGAKQSWRGKNGLLRRFRSSQRREKACPAMTRA